VSNTHAAAGASLIQLISASPYYCPMRAKIKNGFVPKICVTCGLPFEWRKKWAKNWENVKYCSKKCGGK